jgi:hypothetical protein
MILRARRIYHAWETAEVPIDRREAGGIAARRAFAAQPDRVGYTSSIHLRPSHTALREVRLRRSKMLLVAAMTSPFLRWL